MNDEKTVQSRESVENGSDSHDDETARTQERIQPDEITLNAVLEIARAAQRINTLDELAKQTVDTGRKKIGLRRAVRSLERICCNPRRIAALMLHAADNPDWAWVNFWAVFCPDMTLKQMAKMRHINISSVKYHMTQVELPSDIYDFIPENH